MDLTEILYAFMTGFCAGSTGFVMLWQDTQDYVSFILGTLSLLIFFAFTLFIKFLKLGSPLRGVGSHPESIYVIIDNQDTFLLGLVSGVVAFFLARIWFYLSNK